MLREITAACVAILALTGCGDSGSGPAVDIEGALVNLNTGNSSQSIVQGNWLAVGRGFWVHGYTSPGEEGGDSAVGESMEPSVELAYYISPDPEFDRETATLLSPTETVSLDDLADFYYQPGGPFLILPILDRFVVEIPAETLPGDYYMFSVADAGDEIPEADETNNVARSDHMLTVLEANPSDDTQKPELNDGGMSGYSSVLVPGGGGSYEIEITNSGVRDCGSESQFRLFMSTDNTYEDGGDVLLGELTVPDLGVGEMFRARIEFTLDSATPTGTYYYIHFIDMDGEVDELNESNNDNEHSLSTFDVMDGILLSIPSPLTAGAGTVTGTITLTRTLEAGETLIVDLEVGFNGFALSVPETVVVEAESDTATFDVEVAADLDGSGSGSVLVSVTASAEGWADGYAYVTVEE